MPPRAARDAGNGGQHRQPGESRSAVRVMDTLDLFFNAREGLTLTEIAKRLDLPKSSAHGILTTMRRRGYLTWDPETKAYSIGLRVVALAQASPILRTIQARARPHLERLARSLHETVMLGAYEADGVVCVDTVESADPVRFTVALGERRPLHATSLGKLYLASLEDEELLRLLDLIGLERQTERTITGREELLTELREIKRTGVAVNRAESIEGVYSYGVPIHAYNEMLVAGLSVVGVAGRMQAKEERIVAELKEAAGLLSGELGSTDTDRALPAT